MKAIQIKYLSATNTKGARYKAWTEAGSLTEAYDYSLDHKDNALALAKAYCAKFGWSEPKGIGSIPNGDYVATLELNDLTKNNIGEVHSCEISEADFYVGSYSIGDRTRAFLKVQDGCDYKCTYCTIPLARGISRSDTLENVLNNASSSLYFLSFLRIQSSAAVVARLRLDARSPRR